FAVAREVAHFHIHPGHRRAPLPPETRSELVSRGDARPPLAGLLHAAGDVLLEAIAVEIADFDINPGDGRAPAGPQGVVKRVAQRCRHPPLATLQVAADDVVLAVAGEVGGVGVDPGYARVPRGP